MNLNTRIIKLLITTTLFTLNFAEASTELNLLSRSNSNLPEHQINNDDALWLENKKELVLGASIPEYKPFDVITSTGDYEGITADVAGLLSKILKIPISVQQFPDRHSALLALSENKIDLLGSSSAYEAAGGAFKLSAPYANDQAALFGRLNSKLTIEERLESGIVSMSYDYIPLDVASKIFPNSKIKVFSSSQEALAALAFGHVDLYFGDLLSTNLLINENYYNYVKLEKITDTNYNNISFLVNEEQSRLLRIINNTLAIISEEQLNEIKRRWSGGTGITFTAPIELSNAEAEWIKHNSTIRVLISNDQAPLGFIDTDGNFSGIAADILKLVTVNTGIKFEATAIEEMQDLDESVLNNRADIVLLTPSDERKNDLLFSRSFISSPFALITRDDEEKFNLSELDNETLAIVSGHVLLKRIKEDHPKIKIVETKSLFDAIDMVANGDATATAAELSTSYYYTLRLPEKKLRIANIIDANEAKASFAMRKDDLVLQSIINKVLISIPPDEINVISTRWRANAFSPSQLWNDYKPLLYQTSFAALLIILVSLFWNANLRRQIHLRKNAELALNQQLRFEQTLINANPHPIYVRDNNGYLLSCNDSYLRSFNLTRSEVIGKISNDGPLSNIEEALKFQDDYIHVITHGEPIARDTTLKVKNRKIYIYQWIQPFRDINGKIKGVVCGWIDISERHELIRALEITKEEADIANKAKTKFLATMSHEIRTPMSAVIGTLELLMKKAEDGIYDNIGIKTAHDAAQDLLDLIGDILDIVRIESNQINVAIKEINLYDTVISVLKSFSGLAENKGIKLSLNFDPQLPHNVIADPLLLRQVIGNSLSNAIKFTEKGTITVIAKGNVTESGHLELQLRIEDTGVGISKEDLQLLFKPFSQGKDNPLNVRGGTGLGLVICRSLCEAMGGSFDLNSTLGIGTQAVVSLKLEISPEQFERKFDSANVTDTKTKPLKVLVVDDHPANRMLLCQQLEFFGHYVESAEDGEQGLSIWKRSTFDVVFTDCNMPIKDGYDLARAIRAHELSNDTQPIKIFGFTANAQKQIIAECISAGMDNCLFKPIPLATLSKILLTISDEYSPKQSSVFESLFCLEQMHKLTGSDSNIITPLLRELIETNKADIDRIAIYINSNDRIGISETAHRIKGAARIISANSVIKSCEELEQLCSGHSETLEDIDFKFQELKNNIYCLELAIKDKLH